jgi:hypothetical protein
VDRWAHAARLDPQEAVRAGAAGTPVGAALGLTRWLVRQLRAHAVRAGVADVLAAGVVDHLPPAERERQAGWLLSLVREESGPAVGEARHPGGRAASPGAGTQPFAPAREARRRRGQHADGQARAVLPFTPTTAQETSDLYVAAAIPPGAERVSQAVWRGVVASTVTNAKLRVDAVPTVLRVAHELMVCADWVTCAARPGWARLAAAAGVCERTVGRVLARLRAWRLLGGVVGGRSAPFARTVADTGTNRCALYVLTAPTRDESAGQGQSVSPSPVSVIVVRDPVPTREERPRAGPLRGAATSDCAAARRGPGTSPGTRLDLPRPAVAWPAHRVPVTKAERLEAALDLRWRVPVLRAASSAGVASVLREFHLAGWTVADVVAAIEHTVDGVRRPHSGADGVRCPRGWLAARLASWRDAAGRPLLSRAQRAEAARTAAILRARDRRRQDAATSRTEADSVPSSGYLACKAALEAASRAHPSSISPR